MLINSPCYECDKRQALCHSSCLLYKEYKEKLQERKEQKARGVEAYRFIVNNTIKRKERWMKERKS